MTSEKPGNQPFQYYRYRLTRVLSDAKVFAHELTEHATVIYTRSELALEEVLEQNHPLRIHLQDIHESAREVAVLSQKIRDLGRD